MERFSPFIPNGLIYLNSLNTLFPTERVSYYFLLLPCFTEITVFNANREDPDQTPRSVPSDLDLRCLPMSHLWDARHKGLVWNNIRMEGNQCSVNFSSP